MTVDAARKWLVFSSLSITGGLLVFFLLAPAAGYPILFAQSLRVLEVLLPTFLGYIGTAAFFVFRADSSADLAVFRKTSAPLVGMLIRGPVLVFSLSLTVLIIAFGIMNSPAAPPGSGISFDQLTAGVSVILGLLAVTTNVAISYLFGGGTNAHSSTSAAASADAVAPSGGMQGTDAGSKRREITGRGT
jgi:hypothetical protein